MSDIAPARTESVLPSDRPLHAKRRLVVSGLGVAAFALFQLLLVAPRLTDAVFGDVINPPVVWVLSRITGLVPFSVAEWLILAYVLTVAFFMARATVAMVRRRRSMRNGLASAALIGFRDLGAIVFLFYVVWGFNYARSPLADRLGWPEFVPPDSTELIVLAEQSVYNVNAAYRALHGVADLGHATPVPDNADLNAAIDVGYARAATLLPLPSFMKWQYGRVKQPVWYQLFATFGAAGVYLPWTAESHVVPQPAALRAYTIAHEKAHQRGINPELEASFMGFLAASLAPNRVARYSAAFYAQARLVRLVPRDERRRLAALRLPGVERDRREVNAWWQQFEGPAEAVGEAMNDRFLRTNRVAGGVRNYELVVQLFVEFNRQTGALSPAGDAP